MPKKLTKIKYDKLVEQQKVASKNNDYSKLIMAGSPEETSMKEYEQENICKHTDVGTDGGGDYCKTCGKRW